MARQHNSPTVDVIGWTNEGGREVRGMSCFHFVALAKRYSA